MTIGITSTYIFSYKELVCSCELTGTKLVTPAAGCRLKVPLTIPAGVGVNRNELLGPAVCSLAVAYLRVGLVGPRPHQVRRCPTICGHILGHYTVNHQVPCHIIDNRQPSSGYSKSFFACTLIFG